MPRTTSVVNSTSITKVRGFVVCKATGNPLAGVPVALWAEVDQGVERPLGLLTSDGAGYVSFDIAGLPSTPVSFILKSPRFDEAIKVLYGNLRPDRPCFLASARPAVCGDAPAVIGSLQNPDLTDLAISPRSFAINGATQAMGPCGGYTPGQAATRDLSLVRTVLTPQSVSDAMWPEHPAGMRANGSAVLPADYALPVARLVMLRQQWWYVGATLGDIVYSLPLAPGETVQLATIEWNRRDRLSRTDSITSLEHLHHDLTRDRTLGETISAALSESQSGFSLMGGTSTSSSAGASLNLEKLVNFPLDIAAGASGIIGAAGSVAVSSGERNVEAESTQILNDSINQSAWALRSLNSTVVVQADQVEGSTVQTRAVTNNNRCHALTVQYYEVLRTFRVETWRERTEAGVLIPYDDFTFTPDVVLRHRLALEAALLTPSLGSAFDSLARVTITPEVYNPATSPTPTSTGPNFAEGRHTLSVPTTNVVDSSLTIEQGSTVHVIATGNAKFGPDVGPGYTPDGATDAADSGYPAPGLRRLSLICRIGNAWHQGGTSTEFTATDEGTMILQANDFDLPNNTGTWSVTVVITRPPSSAPTPTAPWQPPGPVQLSRTADEAAGKLLVRHLNDNAAYYSRAIWLLMDAGDRRALLEQFLALNRGLLAHLGDTPIATFGKWLIFPLVRTTIEETDPDDYRRMQLVSLPSRGLLAEAELGSCNACEQRDVTRAMDWPLTQPTPITGVRPGPQGQMPTAPQPASLPAPIVAIQQAPSAPDPVGLAGALSLLGQPNIFRDMSGLQQVSQLLDDLVNGTVSETNAALRAASARAALRGSGVDSSGSGTGGAPSQRSAPSTTDPGRQVDRLNAIKYALDQGQITDDQANDAAVGVLGGEVLPASFQQQGITSSNLTPCVNESVTFTLMGGTTTANISWSGGSNPPSGAGSSFTTRFDTPGYKTVTAQWNTDAGTNSATINVTVKELSGAQWAARYPQSNAIADLASPFRNNVQRFYDALIAAGVQVSIDTTYRPRERAYLMHYAPEVANDNIQPQAVPLEQGVNICWLHRDANGNPDLATSRDQARQLANAYHVAYPAAFPSRHSLRLAIDMTLTWNQDITIIDGNGQQVHIDHHIGTAGSRQFPSGDPRRTGDPLMHTVGASYGVLKLVNDPPHWSDNGH